MTGGDLGVPPIRVHGVNERPLRTDGDYVLYWMIAQRRTRWNFGLQRAIEEARRLGKPLVVLEALRCGYRWASDRLHRFVLDGMRDNMGRFDAAGIRYLPYLERKAGEGTGLLEALASRAALVVTDEFPCFFLPAMVRAAGSRLDVRLEQVDGNGLLPLRAAEKPYPTAYSFRRHLQKTLPDHLSVCPEPEPLADVGDLRGAELPPEVAERWSFCTAEELADPGLQAGCEIDHEVGPVELEGGSVAGELRMEAFLDSRLDRYGERNQPEADAASGLSPYFHFGHVSAHEVAFRALEREDWSPDDLAETTKGKREGWWGAQPATEGFLDELITWRELGYGFAFHRPDDYDSFNGLPDWARASLEKHALDEREYLYSLEDFAAARTHDELWNAAQRQLLREGVIHNYLRMLWGKKILEWTRSPQEAFEVMVELNNRYALDGRNPNSYSGISWTLGRFDRPWAPERPVFGVIRFMSSQNTARKLRVKGYLERYGTSAPGLFPA